MTNVISEDALQGQQNRIMNALKAQAAPSQQQMSPQDLLQATLAGNKPGGDYFSALKEAQTGQAQNNLAAQTGIYAQMKEQVARGNTNAAAVDSVITGVAGDDPKIYAALAQDLHSDPEAITPTNAKQKVMKYAADRGIIPLAQQQEQAKTTKAIGEANMATMFNPNQGGIQTQVAPTPNQANNSIIAPNKITEPDATGQYNEQFLSTLTPALAAQIRGIARGDLTMPNGRVLQTPYGQSLMNAVMQYDPSASEANLATRKATRISFTSGKDADAIGALNTALFHAGNLSKHIEGLNNSTSEIYNAISNPIATGIGKTSNNIAFQDVSAKVEGDARALGHELAKVFRAQGMSEGEAKDWEKSFNINRSPVKLKSALDEAMDLMDGRLYQVGQKYQQGMGKTVDPIQLLSPKARATYQTLRSIAPEAQPISPNMPGNLKISSESAPAGSENANLIQQATGKSPYENNQVVDYKEYFK